MIVKNTSLKGLLTIEPKCFNDERGFFLETYHEKRYKEFEGVYVIVIKKHLEKKIFFNKFNFQKV
jgi:dTDP-4-dehydrorhamnose 3,5-epimerase-like enzyme